MPYGIVANVKGRLVKDGVPESAVDRAYVALMKEMHAREGQ